MRGPSSTLAEQEGLGGGGGQRAVGAGRRIDRGALGLGHDREPAAGPRELRLVDAERDQLPEPLRDRPRRCRRRTRAPAHQQLAPDLLGQLRRRGPAWIELPAHHVLPLGLERRIGDRARHHASERRQIARDRFLRRHEPRRRELVDRDAERPRLDLACVATRLLVLIEGRRLRRGGNDLHRQIPGELGALGPLDLEPKAAAGVGRDGAQAGDHARVAVREDGHGDAHDRLAGLQHQDLTLYEFHGTVCTRRRSDQSRTLRWWRSTTHNGPTPGRTARSLPLREPPGGVRGVRGGVLHVEDKSTYELMAHRRIADADGTRH